MPFCRVNISVTNAIHAIPTATGAMPGTCSTRARPPAAIPAASSARTSTVPSVRYRFANVIPPVSRTGAVLLAIAQYHPFATSCAHAADGEPYRCAM